MQGPSNSYYSSYVRQQCTVQLRILPLYIPDENSEPSLQPMKSQCQIKVSESYILFVKITFNS